MRFVVESNFNELISQSCKLQFFNFFQRFMPILLGESFYFCIDTTIFMYRRYSFSGDLMQINVFHFTDSFIQTTVPAIGWLLDFYQQFPFMTQNSRKMSLSNSVLHKLLSVYNQKISFNENLTINEKVRTVNKKIQRFGIFPKRNNTSDFE